MSKVAERVAERFEQVLGNGCSAEAFEHEGAAYIITRGTGEGDFVYSAVAADSALDQAADAEDRYQVFCDYCDPVADADLARAILVDRGVLVDRGGSCSPVLDEDDDAAFVLVEDGIAYGLGATPEAALADARQYGGDFADEVLEANNEDDGRAYIGVVGGLSALQIIQRGGATVQGDRGWRPRVRAEGVR